MYICATSSLYWVFIAVRGLSLVASGGYSSLLCVGFSLWCLLLLQSTGCRHTGFSNCGSRALEHRLSSCGAWALLLHGMWDPPGPGLEPVSPALAGRFLTTAPPEKPLIVSFNALKFLTLRSNLSIFSFVVYAFNVISKNLSPNPGL